ncbi:insecticidal delta-endotoxin Cry8Ea1 family protein, partial [Bacillus mycoides]
MNSYENKNEYEILDASPNNSNMSTLHPRYPLANDPQAAMQNTNYKDWLTMCDSNTQFVGDISKYSSLEAYTSAKASIGFGLGLTSTILGIFGGPISLLIGTIIGVTTAVLDFLPGATDSGGNRLIWTYLIDYVKELINDAINTEALSRAKSILDGISNVMGEYESKLKVWKDSIKSRGLNEEMVALFIATNSDILGKIPQLQQLGHQVSFLPLFAVAANFHLLLLRDASVYGKLWGMSDEYIKDYYSGKNGQLNKTKEYTNYAVTVYREGLEKSKKVAVSNSDNFNWENYNQYRRSMTLTVLDVIALFPTYDNHIYNKSTKVELTRDVYTDLISYIKNPFLTNPVEGGKFEGYTQDEFNAIENALIRPPHLFTWLREITSYSYQQYAQSRYITAMQNKYYYTFGNSIITGPIHGPRYSGDTTSSLTLTDYQDIYSTLSSIFPLQTYDHVRELTFGSSYYYAVTGHLHNITNRSTGNKTQKILGEDTTAVRATGPSSVRSEIPYKGDEPPTATKYSHRLSYISAYATDCGANANRSDKGCHRTPQLCAWTHTSVDPDNRIYPDKITQIPAVKSYYLSGGLNPAHVSDHTGGNVVLFNNAGSIKILCKFTSSGYYKMRIRYASQYSGTITVNGAPASFSSTTNTRSNLPYEAFQYTDVGQDHVFLIPTPDTIEFTIYGGVSGFMIDKFEFIPRTFQTTQSALDYTDKQSLEKVQNVVNDLFT